MAAMVPSHDPDAVAELLHQSAHLIAPDLLVDCPAVGQEDSYWRFLRPIGDDIEIKPVVTEHVTSFHRACAHSTMDSTTQ